MRVWVREKVGVCLFLRSCMNKEDTLMGSTRLHRDSIWSLNHLNSTSSRSFVIPFLLAMINALTCERESVILLKRREEKRSLHGRQDTIWVVSGCLCVRECMCVRACVCVCVCEDVYYECECGREGWYARTCGCACILLLCDEQFTNWVDMHICSLSIPWTISKASCLTAFLCWSFSSSNSSNEYCS